LAQEFSKQLGTPCAMTGKEENDDGGLCTNEYLEQVLFSLVQRAVQPLVKQLSSLEDEVQSLRIAIERNGASGGRTASPPRVPNPRPTTLSPGPASRDTSRNEEKPLPFTTLGQLQAKGLISALSEQVECNNDSSEATLKPLEERMKKEDGDWLFKSGWHSDHTLAPERPRLASGDGAGPIIVSTLETAAHLRSAQSEDSGATILRFQAPALSPVPQAAVAPAPLTPRESLETPQRAARMAAQEVPDVYPQLGPSRTPKRSTLQSELRSVHAHSPAVSSATPVPHATASSYTPSNATVVSARGPMTPVVPNRITAVAGGSLQIASAQLQCQVAQQSGSATFPMTHPLRSYVTTTSPQRARASEYGTSVVRAAPANIVGGMSSTHAALSMVGRTSPRGARPHTVTAEHYADAANRPWSPTRLRYTAALSPVATPKGVSQELSAAPEPIPHLSWMTVSPTSVGSAVVKATAPATGLASPGEPSPIRLASAIPMIDAAPADTLNGVPVMERCSSARRERQSPTARKNSEGN